ncbi:DNA repair protein rad16 [Entomophthora muscae]|uniref:DNA repair protein rad16 n=1 Tax=Entomophthora muscae TaxID=34485 RepID=A0ACC2TMY8_9FUNG|nr:DNA repair protein rad16 [Entomophthora muscae]
MKRSARIAKKVKDAKALAEEKALAQQIQNPIKKTAAAAPRLAPVKNEPLTKRCAARLPAKGKGSNKTSVTTDSITPKAEACSLEPGRTTKRLKKAIVAKQIAKIEIDESSSSADDSEDFVDNPFTSKQNNSLEQNPPIVDLDALENMATSSGMSGRQRRAAAKKPIIEVSSEDSEVEQVHTSDISDTSSSDSSDEVSLMVATRSRRAPQRARRRNNGNQTEKSSESRAYYRTHPTQNPEVWEIHPEIETIWKVMDAIPLIETQEADQPADLKLKLLPFQKEGLNWMKKQELGEFCGGLLADEMGMGKTIQMISLLLSEPRGKPNLIVAPTVALMQWCSEIKTHTTSLTVLMFHGQDRTKSIE